MSASFRVFLNHASSSFGSVASRRAPSAAFRCVRSVHGGALITARYASTEVTAALVKELRERSGAPMMDCKKALSAESVNGDISKAMDYLRAKGLAKAASNDRVATQGLVSVFTNKDRISVVEINCETDFVNNNKLFQDFVGTVAAAANASPAGNIDVGAILSAPCAASPIFGSSDKQATVKDALGDVVTAIRENIVIRRIFNIAKQPDDFINFYVHGKVLYEFKGQSSDVNIAMGQQLGLVIVNAPGASGDAQLSAIDGLTKKLAMHVVAAKPQYLSKDQVPADIVAKETEISKEQSAAQSVGKKPEVVEKMISGKVAKRLGEICLMDQVHMAEESGPIVSKHVAAVSASLKLNLKVKQFIRWTVGQSL